ncbi:MAG: glycosyltransferase [Pseudomonadota bacterium]
MAEHLTVVVLNWRRPGLIDRALRSLARQTDPHFDVVVVSDLSEPPIEWAHRVTWCVTDQPGVARARTLALSRATGDLIAFLDDDAVAHPGWIAALRAALRPGDVAIGGPVLGPDGVRPLWSETFVDRCGEEGSERPGAVHKLNGTNMMIRRDAVEAVGGFDPGFDYFHDDTDMVLRLAPLGGIGWATDAIVQHGVAANAVRDRLGVPTAMTPLMRSTARLIAKHAPENEEALDRFRTRQRGRIRRAYMFGELSEQTVRRLEIELDAPVVFNESAPKPVPPPRPGTPLPFGATAPQGTIVIVPDLVSRARARTLADTLSTRWDVRLIELRFSPRSLRVGLTKEGWWHHLGGVYGRPRARFRWRRAVAQELGRMGRERPVDHLILCRFGTCWQVDPGPSPFRAKRQKLPDPEGYFQAILSTADRRP